jgi:hypothetical protein
LASGLASALASGSVWESVSGLASGSGSVLEWALASGLASALVSPRNRR